MSVRVSAQVAHALALGRDGSAGQDGERVWRGCVAGSRVYRGFMEYLRGPLYLDIAAKGLCFVGVVMMIFGQGGWFIAVVIGVVCGALSMVAGRRMGQRGWDGVNRVK